MGRIWGAGQIMEQEETVVKNKGTKAMYRGCFGKSYKENNSDGRVEE